MGHPKAVDKCSQSPACTVHTVPAKIKHHDQANLLSVCVGELFGADHALERKVSVHFRGCK